MTDRPKTTLRDCIYGLAVGDALGVPYEFRPRGTFECTDMIGYGTHGQPDGTWSDDTSMTLATCDSIRELGHIDTADMRDKFVGWIARDEYTIDGVSITAAQPPAPCTPAKEAPASATTATDRSCASRPWRSPMRQTKRSARSPRLRTPTERQPMHASYLSS